MKIFAIVLVSLFAFCKAEHHKIDGKLISPDFLFDVIYEYQDQLDVLQDEINLAIKDVQSGMSSVLATSTDATLNRYNVHVTGLHAAHGTTAALFANVQDGQCKNDSLESLAFQLRLSGNRKSNCARTYDALVQNEIDAANVALKRIDDFYSQVQSIAVKSFIGKNAFLDPEEIQYTIMDIYDLVKGRWADAKPELETIRQSLANRIATHDTTLGACLTTNTGRTQNDFNDLSTMVSECNDYNSLSKTKSVRSYSQKLKEITDAAMNVPEFVWAQM